MKLAKKIISIYLSSLILLPSVCAIKRSISVPEDLCQSDHIEVEDLRDSPYELYRDSERIIREYTHAPIEKTINDTACMCIKTFRRIRDLLCNRDLPSDYSYIAGLLNYVPIMRKIKYIVSDIILSENRNILLFSAPSPTTKSNINASTFIISSAVKKYEHIFWVELQTTFSEPSNAQQIYNLMYDIWEGIWTISQQHNFRD